MSNDKAGSLSPPHWGLKQMPDQSVGDERFYRRSGPFSAAQLAQAAGGTAAPSERMFSGVAPLGTAMAHQVSFLDNRRYAEALDATQAGAVIVHPDMAGRVPATATAILAVATYEGWARVMALFHPVTPERPGVHPLALVAPDAVIDPTAQVAAFATVGAGVRIGARSSVAGYAILGEGVVVGEDCRIGAHASLSHAVLGNRVFLFPGVRIGQEGFSFAHTKTGFLTIPQLGRVLIEDDVEVGANSCIDRGSIQDTVIGAGSRIDNLVQIGHNVRLGRYCVVVAQVGISGSTVLEDFVQVGGQAAFAGHLRIGKGAQVGAQAGVIGDVAPGAILLGSPAQPRYEFFRQAALLKKLSRRPPH